MERKTDKCFGEVGTLKEEKLEREREIYGCLGEQKNK
jgi:hypothetical protein